MKASSQYRLGMWAIKSKESPISVIWWCFLSSTPFFSWVWGHDTLKMISQSSKIFLNEQRINFNAPLLWNNLANVENWFSAIDLKCRKHDKASNLASIGYNQL